MTNRKITIDIKNHEKIFNPVYYKNIQNKIPTQIYFGGSSSGKSYFILAQRTVIDILKSPERNYLIVRKVGKTNRQSTFNQIRKGINALGVEDYFKINKTEMTITCLVNGNQILFAGLDDVDKLKSITPENGVITDIVIEEATEISRTDYKQLTKRLRGRTKVIKRIIMMFNPIFKTHWIFQDFFVYWDESKNEYQSKDLYILKTTYLDNKFLTEDDIERIESETDPYFVDVYVKGNWGVIGNVIYKNYTITKDIPEQFDEIIYGLDFGFNNPSAITKVGFKDQYVYVFDELCERGLTNQDLIEKLPTIIDNRSDNEYGDSAEPQRIEEISRAGYNIFPADKSVKDGIDYVKRQKIFIHPKCVDTISEIRTYKWKEDRNGNVLDEPVKFRDHLMDAIRYALYTHSKQTGAYASVKRSDIYK